MAAQFSQRFRFDLTQALASETQRVAIKCLIPTYVRDLKVYVIQHPVSFGAQSSWTLEFSIGNMQNDAPASVPGLA